MKKPHHHEGHQHAVDERHQEHHPHQEEGHDGHQQGHGVNHSGHEEVFRKRFWISLILSVPVLIFSQSLQNWIGYSAPVFPGISWFIPLFSILVFIYGGLPFIQMAVPELKNRSPGMMSLISMAIIVALVYSLAASIFSLGESFYWELVTLIDIMLLGHWIEMRSVRQASGSLTELARLLPDTAELIRQDGSVMTIPAQDLSKGDNFLVKPGSSVPADGIVVEGVSQVSESMITGESLPVEKRAGDTLIAGTINAEGSLRVRVSATGEDTALAGIMRLVKEAQISKSRTQVLADKAAGWLFYLAIASAFLTGSIWIIAVGFDIEVVKRVVTVLVIACPHALGLAVPLVVAISTSRGAENGILVRNRIALEEARRLDVVVFDKTGTLTSGKFGITGSYALEGWSQDRALAYAAALEENSEHLIAMAIRAEAAKENLENVKVEGFTALKGRGVKAEIDGGLFYLGGPRLLDHLSLSLNKDLEAFSAKAGSAGQTVIYLVQEKEAVAAFSLADLVREESRGAVRQLQEQGIEVVMLTGDSREVAQSVAADLNILRFYAEVLPEDKDKTIRGMQKEGKIVAMVGDGINDAPALTRADIGIAIGSGTDIAVASADLILVKNNPQDIPRILNLSRMTYRKMVQNLIWATGYNLIAIPLAAGVLAPIGFMLSPAVGALLMSLSTVVVALNAQQLRRVPLDLMIDGNRST